MNNLEKNNKWYAERKIGDTLFRVYMDRLGGRLEAIKANKTIISSTDAFQYLSEETLNNKTFWKASLEMTAKCNVHCIHCYVGNERYNRNSELDHPQILDILAQLRERNLLFLQLTGGEFFLRPDALRVVQASIECGFATIIQSNGTLITKKRAYELSLLPLCGVEISVYGLSSDTHDRVTQMTGSYQATLNGLQELKNAGVPTMIKFVITHINVHEVDQLDRWSQKLGFVYSLSPQLTPARDGSQKNDLGGFSKQIVVAMEKIISDGKIDIKAHYRARKSCKPGVNRICISADGFIRPCEFLTTKLCDLKTHSVAEAFEDKVWRDHRKMVMSPRSACRGCLDEEFCHICPAAAKLIGDSYQSRPLSGCQTAEKIRHLWYEKTVC